MAVHMALCDVLCSVLECSVLWDAAKKKKRNTSKHFSFCVLLFAFPKTLVSWVPFCSLPLCSMKVLGGLGEVVWL